MRIFIASKDPDASAEAFRREFPQAEVMTDLAAVGDAPVPYVVVGKPEPGVLSSIPGIELILSLNAGVEHLLKGGEVPDGVPIKRMSDPAMSQGMSDWVLAVVLAWHRNLWPYRDDTEWTPREERLSRSRTVAVLGAGVLGGECARLLSAVGFATRVWSRSGREVPGAEAFGGAEGLIAATTEADVVVNLLPLTPQTEGVLNAELFARMTPGGFVASAGRGAHLVDSDLIAALEDGQIGGAALDVFRTEPLPQDDPLWRHPRILVTPHVAAPTQTGSGEAILADAIRRHMAGEPIDDLVDPGAGY